ncbi:MAG: hypothetical protein AAF495_25395 [Pseudomonadota bacterium]
MPRDPYDHVYGRGGKRILTPGKCRAKKPPPALDNAVRPPRSPKPNSAYKPILREHVKFKEAERLIKALLDTHKKYVEADTLDHIGLLSVIESNTSILSRAARHLKTARRAETYEEQAQYIGYALQILED